MLVGLQALRKVSPCNLTFLGSASEREEAESY